MAWVAPTTRSDGFVVPATEWNQEVVDNPNALRTGAIAIASQAANDLIYASSASQLARLAAGTAGQLLQTNGAGSAPTWITPLSAQMAVPGRLSLTTAVPVTSADVTAAGTLYYALHHGNQIGLYNGSLWVQLTIAELSLAVPATTNQMYDVFVDYNSGTPQLVALAWTNDSTRATALTRQDGILVKTGATGQRYVGSFRTTGVSGQTEDSAANRLVWNYYHRVGRPLVRQEGTNTWEYDTATWRQANNSASNQVAAVVGVAEDAIALILSGSGTSTITGIGGVSIGEDSTTTPSTPGIRGLWSLGTSLVGATAHLHKIPAAGYHFYTWLEIGPGGGGTTTWYGDNGGTVVQTGLSGVVRG